MPEQNLIDSKYITIVNFNEKNLLLCYGWYYASDPPQLTIFDFETEKPRVVFNKNFEIDGLVLNEDIVLRGFKSYHQYGSYEDYQKNKRQPDIFTLKIENGTFKLLDSE